MVVEKQCGAERYAGVSTVEALGQAVSIADVLAQAGVDVVKAFKRSTNCSQLREEVPRTNRQESFGKLFRKKGRRW